MTGISRRPDQPTPARDASDRAGPGGFAVSRRGFLRGAAAAGAFVLAARIAWPVRAQAQHGPGPGPFDPNVFLEIGPDDSVTLLIKHLEMGQGVTTGATTVVADELDADWASMRFGFAPSNPALYNNLLFGPVQATGGSTSTAESWMQMRQVGAAARAMLVAAAAAEWGVPAAEITVSEGVVAHAGSGRSSRFGALAAAAMKMPVPQDPKLKDPKDWKLIGTRLPRLDSVAKTNGTAKFALDMRRPGMLTAVVLRPPQFGATLATLDDGAARAVKGVVDVVRIPQGVAVVAKDTWSAIQGREALKATWDDAGAEKRSTAEMVEEYRALTTKPGLPAGARGDAAKGLAAAAKTVEAEFVFPFLAHAPMEPLNAVLELTPDGAELWAGSQLQTIDDGMLTQFLGLKPGQVKVHTMLGGGSFGRRGNPAADWVLEAGAIAKATGGRAPIHLVWTREDDIKGGYYRPMVLHSIKAGVTADGRIAGWQHKVATKSIFTGTAFEGFAVKDGVDASSVEGVADTPYGLTDFAVEAYNATTPVPVLWWRSVGHSHTAHVMETMIDDLAHAANADPVDFRLALLDGKPRDQAVIRLAAEKANWSEKAADGKGRGFAYHFSFGTRVALVADVTVDGSDVKVDRIVAAVDCGIAVNPDIVLAQVQGAIGFALSAVKRNQVTFDGGSVEQSNFDDYEPTRMSEMPKVEVHIVPSTEWPSGIGEPGLPPLAPAIGNAIFAATGKRLRSLPLDLESLTRTG